MKFVAAITDPEGHQMCYGPFETRTAALAWMQGSADEDRENGPGYKYRVLLLWNPTERR